VPPQHSDDWSSLWAEFESLRTAVARVKAVNINSASLRESARDFVQRYFRTARSTSSVSDADLQDLDAQLQRLLFLANGRNPKQYYSQVLRQLQKARSAVDIARVRVLGAPAASSTATASGLETAIASTLEGIVPSAASSYRQALRDLQDASRLSYRGPASELRESLRELLDHLAPDKDVLKSPGFRLERDRTTPTMKQKVRFVLSSRGLGKTALETPEASVARIDEALGTLTRSVYNRGSLSTHVAATRTEVLHLKTYVEGVLAELLQVHARS